MPLADEIDEYLAANSLWVSYAPTAATLLSRASEALKKPQDVPCARCGVPVYPVPIYCYECTRIIKQG